MSDTEAARRADLARCPTCHGEPCDKCGGSGKQIEEHAPWAREVVGCGWCHGQPCPSCGRYNNARYDGHDAYCEATSSEAFPGYGPCQCAARIDGGESDVVCRVCGTDENVLVKFGLCYFHAHNDGEASDG